MLMQIPPHQSPKNLNKRALHRGLAVVAVRGAEGDDMDHGNDELDEFDYQMATESLPELHAIHDGTVKPVALDEIDRQLALKSI